MGLLIFFGTENAEDCYACGERYAFVFDGMAGIGGRKVRRADGEVWTEAKIASHVAAQATRSLMEARLDAWTEAMDFSAPANALACANGIAREVGGALTAAIHEAAGALEPKPERLPTTVAGWISFPMPDGRALGVALWAGDSRCYAIDARRMKLFSDDDTRVKTDAMLDCMGDSLPISRKLCLGEPLELNCVCHVFEAPTLLMACSDGFYKGIPSPMHLEYWFRGLGEPEEDGARDESEGPFEAMARRWRDFIVGEGRLDDDSQTLATLFVNADPEDATALREMLMAPVDDLEARFIAPFPEDTPTGDFKDISGAIGQFAKGLVAGEERYRFHAALKDNALRWAMDEEPLPEGLPCASAVQKMRMEAGWNRKKAQDRREPLERGLAEAGAELEKRVAALEKTEATLEYARSEVSPETSDGLDGMESPQDALDIGKRALNDIARRMKKMGSRIARGEPCGKTMARLEQDLVDLCACVNAAADAAQMPRLSRVSAQAAVIGTRRVPLSEGERLAVCGALSGADAIPAGEITLSVGELAELTALAKRRAAAQSALDDILKEGDAVEMPSLFPLEEHLRTNPRSDARYVMETWLRTGGAPEGFRLSEELGGVFRKYADELARWKRINDGILAEIGARRKRKLELWEAYRPGFEAWMEPLTFRPGDGAAAAQLAPEPEAGEEAPEGSEPGPESAEAQTESAGACEGDAPACGASPERETPAVAVFADWRDMVPAPSAVRDDEYGEIPNE